MKIRLFWSCSFGCTLARSKHRAETLRRKLRGTVRILSVSSFGLVVSSRLLVWLFVTDKVTIDGSCQLFRDQSLDQLVGSGEHDSSAKFCVFRLAKGPLHPVDCFPQDRKAPSGHFELFELFDITGICGTGKAIGEKV
jgi:hypothetical protein